MTALPSVRTLIAQAEKRLELASDLLRQKGFPEGSDALDCDLQRLRVWTQDGGWIDHLEKPSLEG